MAHLTREQQRYKLLLDQLKSEWVAEHGGPWGFELQMAPKLGTSPATLNRIKDGVRKPGMTVINAAIREFRLDRSFFYGTFPEDPHYSKFRGMRSVPSTGPSPTLQTFLDGLAARLDVTDAERDWLLSQSWPGEPTEESYYLLLKALRTVNSDAEDSEVAPMKKRARKTR